MFSNTTQRSGNLSSISYEKKSSFEKLKTLEQKWYRCLECPFGCFRENMVWGKGNIDSGIVLIGEAPGKDENEQGIPFVGKAGMILEEGLYKAGLFYDKKRANCLIINALACRPSSSADGSNRTPKFKEILNCRERLQGLLSIARPSLVILLGNTATSSIFDLEHIPRYLKIGRVEFLKTYHPMATVYDKSRLEEWKTFWKLLRRSLRNDFKHTKTTLKWKLPLG